MPRNSSLNDVWGGSNNPNSPLNDGCGPSNSVSPGYNDRWGDSPHSEYRPSNSVSPRPPSRDDAKTPPIHVKERDPNGKQQVQELLDTYGLDNNRCLLTNHDQESSGLEFAHSLPLRTSDHHVSFQDHSI